mmetsp:Transcript_16813/g.48447  ORF Transcript_16813/g.48447 Transcript_16813/m.48447 type:complete len:403 (+) Transcript_16813:1437-2645(+)
MDRQVHPSGVLREQAWMNVDAPSRPIFAERLAQNPHVSHQQHVFHPGPGQNRGALRIVLFPCQSLRRDEFGGHRRAQRPSLLQNGCRFAVGHDRHDLGVNGGALARFDDGEEGRSACGSEHTNTELFANGALGNVGTMMKELRAGVVRKVNLGDTLVRRIQSVLERRSQSRHGQHSTTGAPTLPLIVELGPCVIHLDTAHPVRILQSANEHPLGVLLGITAGGANDGSGRLSLLESNVDVTEFAVAARDKRLVQIILEEGENYLRFRIAEAAVEFEHGRSGRGEHHARVQNSYVRRPPLGHLLHGLDAHVLHLPLNVRRDARRRRIRPHTPGIQPLIPIESPLVILRRGHEYGRLTVAQRQTARLRASHERFHHARIPRGAERPVAHNFLDRRNRLLLGGGQ